MNSSITLEQTYATAPETIWRLWTTPEGIESWWAPDGFRCDVRSLDLRVGGELVHALTATSPEMIEFMNSSGMPLTTEARKTFTELDEPQRIAYTSVVDFVPGHEPYEHLTTVDITPSDGGTHVAMAIDPLHDEEWTQRIIAGRTNELENLARVV
jgi:uncharacterized protein YndB with AHSA1/START domain